MGAGEIRAIKRRVKSVQSTKKITRAMELIESSRIVKAERRLREARPYAEQMASVIANLANAVAGRIGHPLLDERETVRNSAVLVITSDRGLAGAYNANVLKLASAEIETMAGHSSVIGVGRKVAGYFNFRGVEVTRLWMGISDRPTYADAKEVAQYVIDRYAGGEIDDLKLAYTRFDSMFSQTPVVVQLLPFDMSAVAPRAHSATATMREREAEVHSETGGVAPDTTFEPDAEAILADILPKGVASRIFSAMLEGAASEHAARRRAMKAATDNAEDLIKALELEGNKARQAAITTEIIEVVAGAQALKK